MSSALRQTYGDDAKPRVGFFTDTTVCIGCKACEVACKEWNLIPEDGLEWTGQSYDNTGQLDANSWRHVAFIEQRKPMHAAPDPIELVGEVATADGEPRAAPLADGVGRLQALHARRLPRRLPDRRALPHRVRHGRRAGGRLQRLRVLRAGVPVRCHRQA